MGSGPSIEKLPVPSSPSDGAPSNEEPKLRKQMPNKKNNLVGFPLVERKCRRRKAAYEKCYADWYQGLFVTGKDIERDGNCDDLFDDYRECILRGMKKDRERRGLKPPTEGSILSEVDDG